MRRPISYSPLIIGLTIALALGNAGAALADCQSQGLVHTQLQILKSAEWKLDDEVKLQSLALAAADCLAAPDPELRDELSFDALSAWMRSEKLHLATLTALRVKMLAALQMQSDNNGFLQPFAILTLSELVRADRRKPYLSQPERIEIVNAGSAYLRELHDYRGFDETEGWRHGIAHSADLMLQLALDTALEKPQHETMLAAITTQIAPSTHFYQYGEGVRLMTAVYYLAKTDSFNKRDWDNWFNKLMEQSIVSGPYTQAKLAQRHNVSAFLLPLYFSVRESADANLKANMLPAIRDALRKVN